jgi:protein-S-isoprenylcysteine O-methyltransferase Ste14
MDPRKRWIELISRTASQSGPAKKSMAFTAGTLFAALIVAIVLLAFWTDRYFGLRASPEYPMNWFTAIPLLAIGTGFWLWSVLIFFKGKGTPVPLNPPPKLITTGPYEFSRNPMMTGLFLALFGIGFATQSVSLVFIYTPLFILLIYLELKWIEEPELEQRLGKEYTEYRKRTPMFWPKKRPRV